MADTVKEIFTASEILQDEEEAIEQEIKMIYVMQQRRKANIAIKINQILLYKIPGITKAKKDQSQT